MDSDGGQSMRHVVVVVPHRGQGIAQAALAPAHLQQLDFRGGDVAVRGQQLVAAVLGKVHGVEQAAGAGEDVQHRMLQGMLVHPAAHGGVTLGIEVDQQHLAPVGGGQRSGEIDARRGLAHPALLVGYRVNLGHVPPYPSPFVRRSISKCRWPWQPGTARTCAAATRKSAGSLASSSSGCSPFIASHCVWLSPRARRADRPRRGHAPPRDWSGPARSWPGSGSAFLAVAVEQGEARLRKEDRQGNARHAAAAAHVQPVPGAHVGDDAEAVQQVPRDHLVGIAHRGEVVGLVPLDQQVQVAQQALFHGDGQRHAERLGALAQFVGLNRAGHQALCSRLRPALRFFRWISSSETAAGVTPGMREA
ncbi:hypothetical protein COLO4_02314 [Corchorus olitorius]|uniref:Uncharacterized protein n=1 Tax=Corchorus olitorius TaxID=93759 RepID=A0A1R3L153_9ROSI|nr:hypothetical protein COLO4_02314 [Corchorus olitorius]